MKWTKGKLVGQNDEGIFHLSALYYQMVLSPIRNRIKYVRNDPVHVGRVIVLNINIQLCLQLLP